MGKVARILTMTMLGAVLAGASATAAEDALSGAVRLYRNDLCAEALNILQTLPGSGEDPIVDGYAVLCAQKLHINGYMALVNDYFARYPYSTLCTDIRKELYRDCFEREDYSATLDNMKYVIPGKLKGLEKTEYYFKRGFSNQKIGDDDSALNDFLIVGNMDPCDYTGPARYSAGYIYYSRSEIDKALPLFELASRDERVKPLSDYYAVLCRYEKHNYRAVVSDGGKLYSESSLSSERKSYLARLMSESYLVLGDKKSARRYYDESAPSTQESTDADYFYAGCLMFTTGEWRLAVEKFSLMKNKADSIGQIANYNTALAYIKLKNKVGALGSFKAASEVTFDPEMTEDAFFNYAKLAFDLGRDTSPFNAYIRKYADKVRGESIYSYMALTALSDRDYQAAINAYDRIDVLSGKEKNNYIHANYLRGAELLDNGSYRNAMQCFKAVTYYTPRQDRVNQLARYYLAEAYYRDGQYSMASGQFTELYNSSALVGLREGMLIPYNIAYSYYKEEQPEQALRWFGEFCSTPSAEYEKDAMTRKADCLFALKRYDEAMDGYRNVILKYFDVNDIYPYYRAGVCAGLLKDTAARLSLLKHVLDADPSSALYSSAMFEYGKALNENKQATDAMRVFRTLSETAPDESHRARALLEMGTLTRNAGKADEALEIYKRVVEQMPSGGCTEDALLAIESIYQSKSRPGEYLAYIESLGKGGTKTEEDRENMYFAAAEQTFFSNDFSGAVSSFKQFKKDYPLSGRVADADYYIGESYLNMGDKLRSCDAYRACFMAGNSSFADDALRKYASLNYSLDNFTQAYEAYALSLPRARTDVQRTQARVGMMRSAVKAKSYSDAVNAARSVQGDAFASDQLVREAAIAEARCLMAMSRRDEAIAKYKSLSSDPKTEEGAEAYYAVVEDSYLKADYETVESMVFAFADSGTSRQYWLAKAFIVLGDSYADQEKYKKATATFQSIVDGYSASDDILPAVRERLEKLKAL